MVIGIEGGYWYEFRMISMDLGCPFKWEDTIGFWRVLRDQDTTKYPFILYNITVLLRKPVSGLVKYFGNVRTCIHPDGACGFCPFVPVPYMDVDIYDPHVLFITYERNVGKYLQRKKDS
jgi:hypothetical protein